MDFPWRDCTSRQICCQIFVSRNVNFKNFLFYALNINQRYYYNEKKLPVNLRSRIKYGNKLSIIVCCKMTKCYD